MYKFVSTFEQPTTVDSLSNFWQIATFINPTANKYHVRKFIINTNNEFVGIKDYFINKKEMDKLMAKLKRNQYKLYSVYDLYKINHPCLADIMTLKSDILGADYNYYGFAPF